MPAAKRVVSQRVLNVVMPFEPCLSGGVMGGVRIVTPRPYATDEYYMVAVNAEEQRAVFMKETGNRSVHVVDLDFGSCDCEAWHRRKACRHCSAISALKAKGII